MSESVVSDSREDSDEDIAASLLKSANRSAKHEDYGPTPRVTFFEYRRNLMSVKVTALKTGVKESTARTWWNNYLKDPDSFVIGKKKTNHINKHKLQLHDKYFQAYISTTVDELASYFKGLAVKKSRNHKFINS